MPDIVSILVMHEGLAHATTLAAYGVTDRQRERAARNGEVTRLRRGWYALRDVDTTASRAIRAGGRLSCVSLLALHGVWLPADERMHIATSSPRSRLRSSEVSSPALETGGRGVVTHQRARLGPVADPVDSLERAVGCAASCLSPNDAVLMLDSVRNLRVLNDTEIARAIAPLSASRRALLSRSAHGAESGTESLVRMLLTALRMRVRAQVVIPGVGRVDLVVGDRLVIEVDSRAHHDNPKAYERDRARDLALVEHGYIVIRVSYHRVMHDPGSIERAVLAVVRRRNHRWPRGAGAPRR